MLLLGVNVGIKVGLASRNGLLDALLRVPALSHVALQLPGKLDIVRDVQVDLEVQQVAHALVVEGVEALNDEDLQARDQELGGVSRQVCAERRTVEGVRSEGLQYAILCCLLQGRRVPAWRIRRLVVRRAAGRQVSQAGTA